MNRVDENGKRNKDFYETYKKIRKPMPPPEKVIKPKNEFRREKFDWRNEIDEIDEETEE